MDEAAATVEATATAEVPADEPSPKPTAEELQKELEVARAERDALAAEKEKLALERETLRDTLATVNAEKADTEEAAKQVSEALSVAAKGLGAAIVEREEWEQRAVQTRKAAEVELENAQKAITAIAFERDQAAYDKEHRLGELVMEECKKFVDLLELPWNGPVELPKQLASLTARLKALEAKAAGAAVAAGATGTAKR